MSKKSDAFYFDNLISVSKICGEAADYLVECLTHYDVTKIEERLQIMHGFEHSADIKKHEMSEALSKAFITPFEREDLAEISHNLDEVADCIEEVLQRFYLDAPESVTDECIQVAQKIALCCQRLIDMFAELHNFKKPKQLKEYIIQISDIEEECDQIYLRAYKDIRTQTDDILSIVAWRKIYDHLESCADACEHVADAVDLIVMKNT